MSVTESMRQPAEGAAAVHPVRIGVVGCGSVLHAYGRLIQSLRFTGAVEVTAACDVEPARFDHVRSLWPDAELSTDYRDLVGSPSVDLVLVLTAMQWHGEIARAALEAGKHVLVEKPMATTLEEASSLLTTAREAPGILVCAPHIVLSPTFHAIWHRVRRGDIGRVLLARARYGWAGPWWGQWYYEPGGGALFDLGVYNVTALTALIGPARRVTAMAGTVAPERDVDGRTVRSQVVDNAHVLLDFGDAVYASVTTGFSMQRYRSPAIEIYGSEGTIQMLGDDWAPQGYELWRNAHGAWEVFDETDPQWEWTAGLAHLVDCIATGRTPLHTPAHAYHALEIMLAAEAAGRDGQAREIRSTFPPLELGEPGSDGHEAHDRRVDRV
jgi:predicted dehydrogenase